MAKKKNPADTTMRNINALKKRVSLLERQHDDLQRRVDLIEKGLIPKASAALVESAQTGDGQP
jgi:hypothetical protein